MADDVGSLLLTAGMVAPHSLEVAREVVAKIGGTLPEQLVRQGDLDDDELTRFYCNQLLVPRINPSQLAKISAKILEKLPADMATEFRAIPLSIDREGSLTLIMSDPSDARAADEIGFFTGCFIIRATTTQALIAWCLSHYYKQTTPLHKDLVEKGDWPKAPVSSEKIDNTEAPTAPLAITIHAEDPDSGEVSVPKKFRRPANQHPSPPELSDRAGEISSPKQRQLRQRAHSAQPAVVIAPLDPPASIILLDEKKEAVPQEEQRGTDTAPFLLSSIKEDGTGPILLGPKGKTIRRPARNTFVGVGAVGSDTTDNPWEQALANHTQARLGTRDTVQMKSIFGDDAEKASAEEKGVDEITEVAEEPEELTDPGSPPESPDNVDTDLDHPPSSASDIARIVDMVGDNWGPPGSTIPPAYIGATPEMYDKLSDSIPILIRDDVTTEMPAIRTEPVQEVDPQSDQTIRNIWAENATPEDAIVQSGSVSLVSGKIASSVVGALRAIDRAGNKSEVVEALLDFLDLGFERNGFLALRGDQLVPWRLHGCPDDASPTLTIEKSSIFGELVREVVPYSGPLTGKEAQRLARELDLAGARSLLALPMTINGRIFGVLFGLSAEITSIDEHAVVLAEAACESFERLIMANRA